MKANATTDLEARIVVPQFATVYPPPPLKYAVEEVPAKTICAIVMMDILVEIAKIVGVTQQTPNFPRRHVK